MKITAIIPAYNEELTIGNLLDTVKQIDILDDIIVVDDGSWDKTCEIAINKGVKTIRLPINQGKSAAIFKGLNKTEAGIIVLLDADLIGLKVKHILDLTNPIIEQKISMTYGLFNRGRKATDLAQRITPFLSGQRAIRREILEDIKSLELTRYGLEMALTIYVKKNNIPFRVIPMDNVTHLTKEEKLGLRKGFSARLKMYWDVIKALRIS